jgi:hypothetical protein
MFDGSPYKDELKLRISTINRMLDIADPLNSQDSNGGISREVRGIAILLLFASYENLMKSLCRGLLEKAASIRVGNRRLKVGFKIFAVHNLLVSVSDSPKKEIWKGSGEKLLSRAFDSKNCSIDVNVWPDDGSFMRKSQVKLFFDTFDLGDPARILREIWEKIDTVVIERNDIAHGLKVPEEVGRAYSSVDLRNLVQLWESRWIEVINHIEAAASSREFYRK